MTEHISKGALHVRSRFCQGVLATIRGALPWVASTAMACAATGPKPAPQALSMYDASQTEPGADAASVSAETRGAMKVEPTFDITVDPDFRDYRRVLTDFARRHASGTSPTFCVLGLVHDDGSKSAWVFWPQGRKLVLWEGRAANLDDSPRVLDLTVDVVATNDQIGGSTYLVTRAWVDDLVARCERSGSKLRIETQDHRAPNSSAGGP